MSMAAKGVSIGRACRLLGISEKELRAMMDDGRLRYRRVNGGFGKPGHVVIRASDVEALLPKPELPPMVRLAFKNRRMRDLERGMAVGERRRAFLPSWSDLGDEQRRSHNDTGSVTFVYRCNMKPKKDIRET